MDLDCFGMALLLAFFHHSSRGCDGCYGFAGEKVGDHPAKLGLAFGVAVAFPSPHRKARKGIAKNAEKILKIQLNWSICFKNLLIYSDSSTACRFKKTFCWHR